MLTVSYILNFAFYFFLFFAEHIKVNGFDHANCIVVYTSSYLTAESRSALVVGGDQLSVSLIRIRGFDFSSTFFGGVFSLDEVLEFEP